MEVLAALIVAGGFALILGFIVIGLIIDGYCLRYLIEYWASYCKQRPVRVRFPVLLLGLLVVLASCVILPGSLEALLIGGAVCTFVASFFMENPWYKQREEKSQDPPAAG